MAEKMGTLRDLLVKDLTDLYSAENQVIKALPKMQKAASSEKLQGYFERHLEETKEQLGRLDQVFKHLGEKPSGKKCMGMEGLIEEGAEVIGLKGDSATKDAALIAAAQKVEHYEIAAYGTLATFAKMLGDDEIAKMLVQTLKQEKQTNDKLSDLAEKQVNREAIA